LNLAHLLQRMARQFPKRAAIFHGAQAVATYAQWAQRCAHLAQQFQNAGLQPGDRVAIFMHNHPRYLEVLFGAWWAGLAVVPINAKLHVREAQWIIENAQASLAFVTSDVMTDVSTDTRQQLTGLQRVIDVDSPEANALWTMPHASDTPPTKPIIERQSDDLAWLFYTSGTTGRPKGVMITHRNLMTMGLAYFTDVDAITDQDAIVYAAPMSHGAGLYAIPHLMAGARHVVPASGGFDAAELFELGQSVGPLSMFAAPTIVKRLVDHAEQTSLIPKACALAFKTIVYGGAPMYAADIQRALRIMGPRFVQIYGQGESPMVGTALSRFHLSDSTHPEHAQRLASIGIAQTPVQIRITDEHGHNLALGEVGEVLIKGDSVMAGYWRNPEATQAAIRDGWLFTGDMGCLDAHGFLTLKDRSKDLIISGGSNVYPREVEEVLLQAPGVSEVAVIGAPDPEWGEVIVAFVVLQQGSIVSAQDLDTYCLNEIARFKRPKRYELVDSLPKNNYGKVLKTELRLKLTQP
jgi:long-chain acyl-CoA synthetase